MVDGYYRGVEVSKLERGVLRLGMSEEDVV